MFNDTLKFIVLILTCGFYSTAQAGDGTIGYANGSLIFTKDNHIGLEQHSLTISSSKITISQTFYNHADHAIIKTVAFPFPAKPYNGSIPTGERPCFDQYVEKTPSQDCPFLDIIVTVNGKRVTDYKIDYLAIDKNGRDITAILKKMGFRYQVILSLVSWIMMAHTATVKSTKTLL